MYLNIMKTEKDSNAVKFVSIALSFSVVTQELDQALVRSVLKKFKLITFKKDDIFCPEDCFYVLTKGIVGFIGTTSEVVLSILEPGGSFGELSLLYGTTTKEKIRCMESA